MLLLVFKPYNADSELFVSFYKAIDFLQEIIYHGKNIKFGDEESSYERNVSESGTV